MSHTPLCRTPLLRDAARHRGDALDQDGPEPRDARAHRNGRFAFGRADEDGGSRFSGYAPAEDHAVLEAALAAVRKQAVMERHAAGEEDNEGLGAEWRERDGEHRTAAQFDYDTVAGIITAGIRASAAEPTASSMLRSIPEVVVTTTVDDLQDARRGSGWIGGLRIPVATVQRISCGADVRLHIDGDAGENLHLGRPTRLFSSAQRKALITRYGGCAWPSCTAPAAWCDAHHIAWYHRDDGPTDVGNGITPQYTPRHLFLGTTRTEHSNLHICGIRGHHQWRIGIRPTLLLRARTLSITE